MQEPLLGVGEPNLLTSSRRADRITLDVGEVFKSASDDVDSIPQGRSQKRLKTTAVDGTAAYDDTKLGQQSDSRRRYLQGRGAFFRQNLAAKDHPVLQEACHSDVLGQKNKVETVHGVLLVTMSTLMFCSASVCVKLCGDIPSVEIGCFRSVYSLMFGSFLTLSFYQQQILPFKAGFVVVALLIVRGFVDFAASNLFYFGCTQVGLGLATVLMFTNPFWAAVIAKFWLGEPYSIKDFAASVLAFLGVVLSALPSLEGASSGNASPSVVICLLLGSVFQAMTYCLIKRISKNVHFMQMTVAYGLCGVTLGPGIMAYGAASNNPIVEPAPLRILLSPKVLFFSCSVACFAIGAQVLLNLGCSRIDSTLAALIRTIDIPLSLIFQYFVFGKVATAVEVIGASLVLMAIVTMTLMKQIAANRKELLAQESQASRTPPQEDAHAVADEAA